MSACDESARVPRVDNENVKSNVYGFVLTRKTYDTRRGMVISLWLITQQGPVNLKVTDEYALLFIHQTEQEKAIQLLAKYQLQPAKVTSLPLKTFAQQPVSGLYFGKLREFYQARELLKQHYIKCFEDDIRPEDRYLMERFVTDNCYFTGQASNYTPNQTHQYPTFYQAKCKKSAGDIKLSMVSIDLECSPKGELYSIGLYSDTCQKVMMIGKPEPLDESYDYIEWLANEAALLQRFIAWVNEYDPDVFIGWNVVNFDFSLFQKRYDLHGIPFAIGRDNSAPNWRKQRNSEQNFMDIEGRVVIDGIDLLKSATYNFASFSLDNVAHELLGKRKQVKDVENRLYEIVDNFHHNKKALAAYNLEDCRLVWQIFEHTDLLAFAKLRAKLTGLSLDRIGGSVAAFTNLYLPKLHRAGYIAPNLGDGKSDLISPGGYVMNSIPGLYRNVLVLDFKSLYPSIIRTFYIDPMGLIEGLKAQGLKDKSVKIEGLIEGVNAEDGDVEAQKQTVPGFDDAYFSRDHHFLPAIIDELWAERDKAKRDKNAALSQAIKIIMNSFYGVLGSTGCRFFDPRLSGSITKRGHQILKTTKQWIEDIGYQVIYGDTDSIFIAIGESHKVKESRRIGKELEQLINQKWDEHIASEYQIESKLEIEFETHFSRFFMPTIRGLADVGTKKRYAGLVINKAEKSGKDNGKPNERMVFKGLETVRTDWTPLAKNFQQVLYHKIFHDQPVSDFVLDTVNQTRAGQLDEKLIYRKRIRRKLDDYVKNVPPHIKAARAADAINLANGQKAKYQKRGYIEYVLTTQGPQAIEQQSAPLDYDLYIERQLKAVADAILPFVNLSFEQITDNQLDLFSS
ncbi:DNA polymerase II [Thalassotalea euphylliae]|uniref:DNA polymerase n=2 Tax=Thalassotalea euphylliae TaxID=1655234 RepID=A0A3E0TW55_9GAMM|nr:DNA polymerase II [Thalassotalea euphylliae]